MYVEVKQVGWLNGLSEKLSYISGSFVLFWNRISVKIHQATCLGMSLCKALNE